MTRHEILRQPTGEVVEILRSGASTGGTCFEIQAVLPPRSSGPPPHLHLVEQEEFEVLEGVVTVRAGREHRDLHAGERVVIRPGTVHGFANREDQRAVMVTRETPAGQLEDQLRLLADSGRLPPLMRLAALNVRHDLSFALAGVPVGLQRPVWRLLGGIHRLRHGS